MRVSSPPPTPTCEQAIANGKFRQDLYYRINVVSLAIPPLCERPEDIPLLVEHFLAAFRKKSGKPIERVAPEALALLATPPPARQRPRVGECD